MLALFPGSIEGRELVFTTQGTCVFAQLHDREGSRLGSLWPWDEEPILDAEAAERGKDQLGLADLEG